MPSIRIAEFDTWRPGYGLATVRVLIAGTNTLASIFTDEALTAAAANPQTLTEKTVGDISYGKFQVPLYVGVPYSLTINSVDGTGLIRPPLTSLTGEDASGALVTPDGATVATALEDHLARRIDVRDYGEFLQVGAVGASASTNNATLVTALGIAAAQGAGYVDVPAGTYQVTDATIPEGVVARGAGSEATILQSNNAGNVFTIGGPGAGFTRLTLDGVSLIGGSVGVYAANVDKLVFDDVTIKRFETGLWRKGGSFANWRDFSISNCTNGYKGHGDSASGQGGVLRHNRWTGGTVELCTTFGVELKSVDSACDHNVLSGIDFDTNTGTAVNIVGARATALPDCNWTGNTVDLAVTDGSPLTSLNSVAGLEVSGGQMDGGALTFSGTYTDVAFRRMVMSSPTITINAPGQNIPVEDCQVSNPTITGVPTCWLYRTTKDRGASFLLTTDNTAHKAWALTLKSGQKVYLEGKVVGRQRDGINTGFYHIAVSVGRPGATLNYDTQTANFTVGHTLTGGTSGATARIVADSDSGTTGALTLQDIIGTFVDNEIITDELGGSALANGGISTSNVALVGTVAAIRAAQETNANWDATFVANGPQIELRVTGDTAQTVEWSAEVQVTGDQQSALVVAQSIAFALAYHSRTGSFTIGQVLTGASSGAKGTLVSDAPSASPVTSGTLTLSAVSGNFTTGETITGGGGIGSGSDGPPVSALVGP